MCRPRTTRSSIHAFDARGRKTERRIGHAYTIFFFLLSHTMSLPYPYPVSNSDLLRDYNLESHFEGGFFKQTVALSSRLQDGVRVEDYSGSGTDWLKTSPGSLQDQVTDATCIYYLITPECSRGRMHMNNHAVYFFHDTEIPLICRLFISTTPGEPFTH